MPGFAIQFQDHYSGQGFYGLYCKSILRNIKRNYYRLKLVENHLKSRFTGDVQPWSFEDQPLKPSGLFRGTSQIGEVFRCQNQLFFYLF